MTIREYTDKTGKKPDTVTKWFRRTFPGQPWTLDTEIPKDIEGTLPGAKSAKGRAKRPAPVKIEKRTAQKWSADKVRTVALDSLLIGIVIGHAGLIWYDCAHLWAMPGVIGGAISFFIVLATVLLSTDATRVRTSETAVWVVFLLDAAAWWVHFPTFKASATIGDVQTGAISAFLCAFSFAALYILRDSKLD